MQSAHLSLPFVAANQAQKHVTVNEGLRVLDALVQLAVKDAARSAPPSAPAPGDRHIIAAASVAPATGLWAGQEDALAVYDENAWVFYAPAPGWRAWDEAQGALLIWDGGAWAPVAAAPELENLPGLGIATTSDATNRLAVASDATLLSHAGGGHQLKVNKAGPGDTASLLFQSGWSGRAEMGLAGSDDFSIKTSGDGSTFQTAMRIEAATGLVSFPAGAQGLVPDEFGPGAPVNAAYVGARGSDLVTNGTGLLGNAYNFPAAFSFDGAVTPNLPGAVSFAGHYVQAVEMEEFLAVDPNQVYRLSAYLRQEGLAGDWSAFTHAERQQQYMGIVAYDVDKNLITGPTHMRHIESGIDSLTTLAAPLSPGDTLVKLTDASGWNASSNSGSRRGLTIFGYKNNLGAGYTHYSRITAPSLFDLAGVDKTANQVTLNAPLSASLGNPEDANGTWQAGTAIANSSSGPTFKYGFFPGLIPATTDQWYGTRNHMGGIDLSGKNVTANFPPGTAYIRIFWLPNFTNRPGGWASHADSGAAHRVWFSGVSVVPEPLGVMARQSDGTMAIKVPVSDFNASAVTLAPAGLSVTALG